MPVHVRMNGPTAVLVVDNAPLNLLSAALRHALSQALAEVARSGADRVILTGAGKAFVAGADAREFDAPPQPPHLPDLLDAIESLPMPTFAAINGTALGGGLEIVLACRYRIAAPKATLGLPETVLGVVPGSGGTQRLPRLIGVAAALDMIPQGRVVGTAEAEKLGLIDEIADDPVAAAMSVPLDTVMDRMPLSQHPGPAPDEAALAAARRQMARRMAGQTAPQRAIDLIEASTKQDFATAVARERETFLALRGSDEAKALRHIFFAERGATARMHDFKDAAIDIRSAVVVGGGNMGSAIAFALGRASIRVSVVETDEAGRERARGNIQRLIEQSVQRGLSPADAAELAQRFDFTTGYGQLPPAELAIEAVVEDMDVKDRVFASLEAALPPEAILATNTSYLDINRMAARLRQPGRMVGLHFFSPAHIMKLLEIVRADATGPAVLATAFGLARRLGKIPVVAGVCDGFIGNRILSRYRRATNTLLLEGATPRQIDLAMRAFGYPMGPYEAQDLSGLDIAYANRQRLRREGRWPSHTIDVGDVLVEDMKRLGRKSSAGWYDYAEDSEPAISHAVEAAVAMAAERAGLARRSMTDEVIQSEAIAAMVAEACDILDEGIAARPSDIDLVLVHGYGFPRWRGGLMHSADRLSCDEWKQRFAELARRNPREWHIPPLIERLASEGRSFADLNG
ncbi:MAG: 3-hydroxyacyl-CoA dehydrogenase [Microvirga sp.]|nr:3-hydroxyacyl-CoA dehydrogenase [Microvirga sp.]